MIITECPNIVTQNSQMLKILAQVKQVAKFRSCLLITGKSGTGKNLIAKYYHYHSPNKKNPFIQIDCASIPSNLIESELFGHEKGAFTGAVQQRIGRFEAANNGTVFLDHVTDLPVTIQSKITRILQEQCFERLGGNETIHTSFQTISASRNSLLQKIKEGSFREDLFFRLSIVPIELPLLRARKGDIPLLIKHFLDNFAAKHNSRVPRLHKNALNMLCDYPWPGNIRELENLMERIIINHQHNEEITIDQIPLQVNNFSEDATLDAFAESKLTLQDIEKLYIQKILKSVRGNKTKAAKILNINRKTLLEKRRKYNLK